MEGVYKPRGEISPRVGNAWVALPAACYTLGFFTPGSIFPLPPPPPLRVMNFTGLGFLSSIQGRGGFSRFGLFFP